VLENGHKTGGMGAWLGKLNHEAGVFNNDPLCNEQGLLDFVEIITFVLKIN
jgi:hypothetical protein